MPVSSYQDVRELHLFSDMSEENFQLLMRAAYVQNFPPQLELIEEGAASDFLHILLSGSVDLFSQWNGRETIMATLRPVSSFILAATVKDAPYLMSARTLEKSRVALIPSADVRRVFELDNAFARAMVTELAECYRTLVKTQKNQKLRTSLERLANYILRHQIREGGQQEFDLPFEKRRLASYLGMTPENLSRAFKGLQGYGVSLEGQHVTISDQATLERFAKPDRLMDDPAY